MQKVHWIYFLRHPVLKTIRYVGKTNNPQKRLKDHLKDNDGSHKSNWVQSLLRQGLQPEMYLVLGCSVADAARMERELIRAAKSAGFDLTNLSYGGEGGELSNESKEKISAALKGKLLGRKLSEEHKEKIGAGLKMGSHHKEHLEALHAGKRGKLTPPEVRQKIRESNIGKTRSKETRARLRESHLGNRPSEETRKRMSESHKAQLSMPEFREKLRIANQKFSQDPEYRARLSDSISRWWKIRKRVPVSEETRKRMSESQRGRKRNIGLKLSSEHKEKISKSLHLWWKSRKEIHAN